MTAHVNISDDAGVRLITLARPEKKNALTQAMYAAIVEAIESADANPAIRVSVITGEGAFFTSGNDLADFAIARPNGDGEQSPAARLPYALVRAAKPIIAVVNGPAVGVGVTLLLQCDIAYAAESATFRTPFVDLALVPEGASSVLLPALVGRARANELLLLGDVWTAADALSSGLVARVFPDHELMAKAMAKARALAEKPPAAVRATKALLERGGAAIEDRVTLAGQVFRQRLQSPEFAAAAAAFLARRKADFSQFT